MVNGHKNPNELSRETDPMRPLKHWFSTLIIPIKLELQRAQELQQESETVTSEYCQSKLKICVEKMENIRDQIEKRELVETDVVNKKSLDEWTSFIRQFIRQDKKLTLEDIEALLNKFDILFPKPEGIL